MPGLDLSQLSSNWKKLQETLQTEQKPQRQNSNLKRKRVEEKAANGFKRARVSDNRKLGSVRGARMGLNGSKEEPPHSDLAVKYGIPQEDISAAYGSTKRALREHIDDINGGLHSTHKVGKYVSLDCEMVGTGPPPHLDHVLARVSLVNFHGEQIYDSYVLPPEGVKVEDYRTFVSGIRPSHLVTGYARAFKEVQKDVAALLQGRILVGHALRNDLHALLLSHPKRDLRDTSRHPKFRVESKGKPPALRNLAKSELGMEIQAGEHSSVEDARAAMMLFQKEKAGFEEENRKYFGRHTKFEAKDVSGSKVNGAAEGFDSEDGSDDDESLDILDDEEDGDAEDVAESKPPAAKTKKKRKKKKRTKRS